MITIISKMQHVSSFKITGINTLEFTIPRHLEIEFYAKKKQYNNDVCFVRLGLSKPCPNKNGIGSDF